MRVHHIEFGGQLLERGFWLHVWRVSHEGKRVLYVGRTGDSSSRYAASPFARLGQHLDLRPSAKANTLLRNIRQAGFDPMSCTFELLAIGPLFPEQTDLKRHRHYRDIVSPLESALAEHLRHAGYDVIGSHPKPGPVDDDLFGQVVSSLKGRL